MEPITWDLKPEQKFYSAYYHKQLTNQEWCTREANRVGGVVKQNATGQIAVWAPVK